MAMEKRQHPSVRFQNGEVKDFYTAMDVYVAQQEEERRILLEIGREYGNVTYKEKAEMSEAVAHTREMAEVAKSIYKEVVEEALKRAAEKMRAHGDPHLRAIADAVESENYNILAL